MNPANKEDKKEILPELGEVIYQNTSDHPSKLVRTLVPDLCSNYNPQQLTHADNWMKDQLKKAQEEVPFRNIP